MTDPTTLSDSQLCSRLVSFSILAGTLNKRITPTEREIMAALFKEASRRLAATFTGSAS